MGWITKCFRIFSLFVICLFSFVKCDGELVVIHQPDIINFYDERPLYTSELRYVFGTCLGYLQGNSAEWHDLHFSHPFDFHNMVIIVAVIPGVETLNVTGIKRIPLMEDDNLNKTFVEIDPKATTTKLFKLRPLKGIIRKLELPKIEAGIKGPVSYPISEVWHKFHEKLVNEMSQSLTDGVPYFFWGDFPFLDETDPVNLESIRSSLTQSLEHLAEVVKKPRKALVALITHTGKIILSRRKREIKENLMSLR